MANEGPWRLDTGAAAPAPPAVAAAFLVIFDHRKGYVIGWQKSIDGVQVEDAVELKSLPSGLHNVQEDLVYFIHDDYVGVSAYINKPDAQAARNVNMLAVGVLVPLHHCRMGKSWLHAQGLKAVARKIISKPSDTGALERYWEEHRIDASKPVAAPEESTDDLFIPKKKGGQANGSQKYRSFSTGSTFTPGSQALAAHHPAATLVDFLDIFGPLIFPLYRAALLRKRILIVTEAPVEFACNIVYNLSVLASLPTHLLSVLSRSTPRSTLRLRPLFTVGIGDIPLLSSTSPDQPGWIACTTDDVLATKPECYEVLVFLPSRDARRAKRKVYPRIVESSPDQSRNFPRGGIKATQRDAERYSILREGLRGVRRMEVDSSVPVEEEAGGNGDVASHPNDNAIAVTDPLTEDDAASTLSTTSTIHDRREIIESPSWSQVAYTSLLWWASAGDRRIGLSEAEEEGRDIDLALLDPPDIEGGEDGRTKELLLVGLFRRLTSVIFERTADVVRRSEWGDRGDEEDQGVDAEGDATRIETEEDDESERGEEGDQYYTAVDDTENDQQPLLPTRQSQPRHAPKITPASASQSTDDPHVQFTSEDLPAISLDMWSAADRKFLTEFTATWFGRTASVSGGGVECCGLKLL